MIVLDDNYNVIRVDKFKLTGKCNRCGECCQAPSRKATCDQLKWETLDGKKQAVCNLRVKGREPFFCRVWPLEPQEELPKGCSYKWIKAD